jgi:hypothetical protein
MIKELSMQGTRVGEIRNIYIYIYIRIYIYIYIYVCIVGKLEEKNYLHDTDIKLRTIL